MAQLFPVVMDQVYTCLSGDGTLVGLLAAITPGQRVPIYAYLAPEQQGYPFIVCTVESNTASDAFNARVRELVFQVHSYVQEQMGGDDPWQTIANIDQRIIGDWPQQASRLPTYGLDRWTPNVTATGWTSDMCGLLDSTPANELGVFHTIHRFRVLCTENGV